MIVRVVDARTASCRAGEVGEVVVDGPTVMSGYLDMPEATAEALRGGALHTGDLGFFDERGRLTLVDRAKDVIITGGYNVYPREVEDVLELDPAVGRGRRRRRRRPRVGRADRRLRRRRPRRRGRRRGARPRAAWTRSPATSGPKDYSVVAELPRNTVGKVLKSAAAGAGGGRTMPRVEILDSTLRDGQQSLWGMRMQAGMALPVADVLDRTGFSVDRLRRQLAHGGAAQVQAREPLGRARPAPRARSTARRCGAACGPTRASPSASRPTP